MNRKERRAAKMMRADPETQLHITQNAYHWREVKRIAHEYWALPEEEKPERKPAFAAEIDEHLAALKVN